jgi:hypothetical protein
MGGRAWNMDGSGLPISNGALPDEALGFAEVASLVLYGFQKFPPMTSAISTLYDSYRSSTIATRGIAPA